MKKLIESRIIKTEERPLSDADILSLTTKRNKQITFSLSGFLPLAAILLYVTIDGMNVITRKKVLPINELEYTDERAQMFHTVIPYVSGFFLIMLIAFFTHHYLRTLAPLLRDLKHKKKLLLHFIPEKTEMGAFNKYYLSTPIVKKQQIEIKREDFYAIPNGDSLVLETAPYSHTVLRFTYKEKEIQVPSF
jgi:hypothetical protein